MARVNVDQRAFSDPRFQILGQLLGETRRHALGLMVEVWNECQERGSYTLDTNVLVAISGDPDIGIKLSTAELAENVCGGLEYRIKGTKGRIEWLKNRRNDAKRGGRPRKTLGFDRKHPGNNPPAPAPAPAPAQELQTPIPPHAPRASRVLPGFQEAWELYPHYQHRSVKGKSLAVWKRRGMEAIKEIVLDRIKAQADSDDWQREGGRFVAGMQVWLGRVDLEALEDTPEAYEPRLGEVLNRRLTPDEIAARAR